MSAFWWSLPGTSAFLEKVADDLRDGRCVVLCLPEHAPDDLPQEVRRALDRDWHCFRAEEMGRDPAEALFDYFDPDAPPELPRSPQALLESDRFRDRTLMVEVSCPEAWGRWKQFLVEYEERARSVTPFYRSVICMVVRGEAAMDAPSSNVGLSPREWNDAVSEMDMGLWVAHLFRDYGTNPTVRSVAISVVTRLALWDHVLARRFAAERIERIFDPMPLLSEVAVERGWTAEMFAEVPWPWWRGARYRIDGRERDHSAALAVAGNAEAIGHRVWSGQVGVLFPFVEERRHGLVRRLADRLTVPFRPHPKADEILDLRDLELSHIQRQLRWQESTLPPWLIPAIGTLIDVRNCIAHFEPVPESYLDDNNLRLLMRAPEFEVQT